MVEALQTVAAIVRDMPDAAFLQAEKELGACIGALQLKVSPNRAPD
jgi:hypothetical protein